MNHYHMDLSQKDFNPIPQDITDLKTLIGIQFEKLTDKERKLGDTRKILIEKRDRKELKEKIKEHEKYLDEIEKKLRSKYWETEEELKELVSIRAERDIHRNYLKEAKEKLTEKFPEEDLEKLNKVERELLHLNIMSEVHTALEDYVDGLEVLLKEKRHLLEAQDPKIKNGIIRLYRSMKPIILSLGLITDSNFETIFQLKEVSYNPGYKDPENRAEGIDFFSGSGDFKIADENGSVDTRNFEVTIQGKGRADSRGQARLALFVKDSQLPMDSEIQLRIDYVPTRNSQDKIIGPQVVLDLNWPGVEEIFPHTSTKTWMTDHIKVPLVRTLYKYLNEGADTYHRDLIPLEDPKKFEDFVGTSTNHIFQNPTIKKNKYWNS
jgi:mRNA-degrading endonuclease HigB of HigAB toxin-antitoxin module